MNTFLFEFVQKYLINHNQRLFIKTAILFGIELSRSNTIFSLRSNLNTDIVHLLIFAFADGRNEANALDCFKCTIYENDFCIFQESTFTKATIFILSSHHLLITEFCEISEFLEGSILRVGS